MKKLTASLLLISLLASLASCGSQDSGTNDTTSSGASTDTTAEETTSQFVKDDLPSDLDLGGKTVGIMRSWKLKTVRQVYAFWIHR